MPVSRVAIIVLLLANVGFDGLRETESWAAVQALFQPAAGAAPSLTEPQRAAPGTPLLIVTIGLALAPLMVALMLGLALAAVRIAAGAHNSGTDLGLLAQWFVPTMLPIAIAYHLAHYLAFLLIAGQLAIPIASDPLGRGWDLFGSGLYLVDAAIIGPAHLWYFSVAVIVAGHAAAVVVAHRVAFKLWDDARRARRSQLPMLALMVLYTCMSLWILAQPIVAAR